MPDWLDDFEINDYDPSLSERKMSLGSAVHGFFQTKYDTRQFDTKNGKSKTLRTHRNGNKGKNARNVKPEIHGFNQDALAFFRYYHSLDYCRGEIR